MLGGGSRRRRGRAAGRPGALRRVRGCHRPWHGARLYWMPLAAISSSERAPDASGANQRLGLGIPFRNPGAAAPGGARNLLEPRIERKNARRAAPGAQGAGLWLRPLSKGPLREAAQPIHRPDALLRAQPRPRSRAQPLDLSTVKPVIRPAPRAPRSARALPAARPAPLLSERWALDPGSARRRRRRPPQTARSAAARRLGRAGRDADLREDPDGQDDHARG